MSHAPAEIDGYTVIRELGRGGMGVVYEVRDAALGRSLALKLLRQGASDTETLLRFGQESELLARVKHPNVVRVHRVGRSAEGPFIVTERVEGEPLDHVLSQGSLSANHAAAIVRDLCDAVAALHAAGVVHRDLKPQNVIIRPDGSPVLIDFGLARDETNERLTQTGTVMGTPNYMSPEQARGETHIVGPASDVYGLGAVLFALLAGVAPFKGLPQAALFGAIAKLDPPWPTDVELNSPAALQAICRRAMSKAPSARPDAGGLRGELDRFLAGGSTAPRSYWPIAVAAGAAAALLSLAALYAAFVPGKDSSPPSRPPPTVKDSPVEAPDAAPRVEPAADHVRQVRGDLRQDSPAPEALAHARELLAGPGGSKLVDLRWDYIKARLKDRPLLISEAERDLPAEGMARWFDDERIVVSSRNVRALWRWNDCRDATYQKVDFTPGGIHRNAAPAVFDSQVYIGGGGPSERGARCYPWDAETPTRTYRTEPLLVTSIAGWGAAGGGQLLAVGTLGTSEDRSGTILIFDLHSGKPLKTLRGHFRGVDQKAVEDAGGLLTSLGVAEVRALVFSRDGRWLISGGSAASDLLVWDVKSWTVHGATQPGSGAIQDIALHPSRPLIAVCTGSAREVRVLRIPGLEEEQTLTAHELGSSNGVRFSRDGRYLYAVSGESAGAADGYVGELLAYEWETQQLIHKRSFRDQALNSVDISPDGRRLVTYFQGKGRRGIEVWDVDVPPGD